MVQALVAFVISSLYPPIFMDTEREGYTLNFRYYANQPLKRKRERMRQLGSKLIADEGNIHVGLWVLEKTQRYYPWDMETTTDIVWVALSQDVKQDWRALRAAKKFRYDNLWCAQRGFPEAYYWHYKKVWHKVVEVLIHDYRREGFGIASYVYLINALENLGRLDDALRVCKKAAEVFPDYPNFVGRVRVLERRTVE